MNVGTTTGDTAYHYWIRCSIIIIRDCSANNYTRIKVARSNSRLYLRVSFIMPVGAYSAHLECGPANMVPIYIDRALFCQYVGDFLGFVVESDVYAYLLHKLDLVVRARRGNNFETFCLGQLCDSAV